MKLSLERRALVLAVTLAVAAPSWADVIVIDGAGGGDFDDLPAAVAAAAEGDVLLVKTGSYTAFELLGKGLCLVADEDAIVTVNGATRIEGLTAGETVLLSGIDFVGAPTISLGPFDQIGASPALDLASCAGSVRVQDALLMGGEAEYFPEDEFFFPNGGHAARVTDCADVAFTSCEMRGTDADDIPDGDLDPYGGPSGGSGLFATSSSVTVNRCTLDGGDGGDGAEGGGGGRGALLVSTELVAVHSTFRAGDGGWGWDFLGSCGPAGHGVWMSGAVLRDLGCFFFAGVGGPGPSGTCPDGEQVTGGTRVTISASPRAMFVERVVRNGEDFQAQYFGQPGDTVLLASAPETAWRYRSLFRGVWLLDRPWPLPGRGVATGGGGFPGLAAPPVATGVEGTLGGAGTITVEHALTPLDPGVEDRVIWFQATMVDASGDPIVTNVQALVLVDDAF